MIRTTESLTTLPFTPYSPTSSLIALFLANANPILPPFNMTPPLTPLTPISFFAVSAILVYTNPRSTRSSISSTTVSEVQS